MAIWQQDWKRQDGPTSRGTPQTAPTEAPSEGAATKQSVCSGSAGMGATTATRPMSLRTTGGSSVTAGLGKPAIPYSRHYAVVTSLIGGAHARPLDTLNACAASSDAVSALVTAG